MHRHTPYALFAPLIVGGISIACQTPSTPTAVTSSPARAASAPASTPASGPASSPASAPVDREARFLRETRQLIFEGRRSGEGYFSQDGTQLVFQAERESSNPFYQIYRLDLESGDIERVSPGIGKTTCSWIHPDGERVLFASTHEDPDAKEKMKAELDFRASGKSRRYAWDYDEHYDLFVTRASARKKRYVNLTKTRGYDAEGSFSPDGKRIAFSSNRVAYASKLSDADQAAFERDPAYMMDIYLMNADGTGVRRLTEAPGYDGGPFFSPDGERIVWRRFSPDGHTAEIWSMKVDGSDKRQITRLGHMSWAPFYHPSGDYLVFTTNVHGFSNFELYIVDSRGEREPVRVTYTDGWDGLPVFSPDGTQLVWSAGRTADKKAQLFIAGWNDAAARRALGASAAPSLAPPTPADLSQTTPQFSAADVRRHVEALTAPAMQGRMTGTEGEARAIAYVASVFEQLGRSPAGADGWRQPFEFTSAVTLGEPNVLIVEADGKTERPPVDAAWRPLAFSKVGSIARAELVFAGYGVVAKADGDQPAYDAYAGLDVEDKWVVVLRYLPTDIPPERRQHLSRFSSLRFKAMEARDRGAKGIIVVTGPTAVAKKRLVPLRFDAAVAGAGVHALSVTDALAAAIFRRAGRDLEAAQKALDGGEVVPGFALSGTRIGGHFTLRFEKATGHNVLARLQVGRRPSPQVVMIGAHLDHLGRGTSGDSLARPDERGQIHPGADDNASGVAALLEIAQYLAEQARAGRLKGRRDIVFAAWSGEELGLYGSTHWANDRLKAGGKAAQKNRDLRPQVAAYLNMDMVGRLRQQAVLQGVASSPVWRSEIERRNVVVGLPLKLVSDTYLPTDATAFYLRGVPILSAFTGVHGEYHTPRDTADRLDYDGTAKIAKLMGLITRGVAMRAKAPAYVKVAPPKNKGTRRTSRVYLGTIPEYAAADVQGVKLSGVSAGGPAEKAGVRAGDVIVSLAGTPISNIYDYVKALDALKIGEATTIVVARGGERVELSIVPGSRD